MQRSIPGSQMFNLFHSPCPALSARARTTALIEAAVKEPFISVGCILCSRIGHAASFPAYLACAFPAQLIMIRMATFRIPQLRMARVRSSLRNNNSSDVNLQILINRRYSDLKDRRSWLQSQLSVVFTLVYCCKHRHIGPGRERIICICRVVSSVWLNMSSWIGNILGLFVLKFSRVPHSHCDMCNRDIKYFDYYP